MENHSANLELDEVRVINQDITLEARITEMMIQGQFREAADAEREQAIWAASIDEPELALSFLDIAFYLRNRHIELEGENLTSVALDEVTKEKIHDVLQAAIISNRFRRDSQAFVHTAHSLNRSLSRSAERVDIDDILDDRDPAMKNSFTVEQLIHFEARHHHNQVHIHTGVDRTQEIREEFADQGTLDGFHHSAVFLRPGQAVLVNYAGQLKLVVNLEGTAQYWKDTKENRRRLETDNITLINELA